MRRLWSAMSPSSSRANKRGNDIATKKKKYTEGGHDREPGGGRLGGQTLLLVKTISMCSQGDVITSKKKKL